MARPRLVNVSMAAEMAAGRCTRPQITAILRAGLTGEGFTLGSSSVYEEQRLTSLLARPTIDRDYLAEHLPGDLVVVVRQSERVETDPTFDPTRGWYGVDALAPDSEQRLASNRYWSIQEHRRMTITQAVVKNGRVPLLVSVGGFIYRGYDITGWDDRTTAEHASRGGTGWAFTLADGSPDWAGTVEHRWLNSGQGSPLIVWKLR